MPLLDRFARTHPAVHVIAVDVGEDRATVAAYARTLGLRLPIWLDPNEDGPPPNTVDLKVRDLDELHRLWRAARSASAKQRRSGRLTGPGTRIRVNVESSMALSGLLGE